MVQEWAAGDWHRSDRVRPERSGKRSGLWYTLPAPSHSQSSTVVALVWIHNPASLLSQAGSWKSGCCPKFFTSSILKNNQIIMMFKINETTRILFELQLLRWSVYLSCFCSEINGALTELCDRFYIFHSAALFEMNNKTRISTID